MLICFISDTHCYFENIHKKMPKADVLVHCGDALSGGYMWEFSRFAHEMANIKHWYEHILITFGNHDWVTYRELPVCRTIMKELVPNAKVLIDEEVIIDGVKFYGAPHTPEFFYWAWMYKRGEEARYIWNKIPDDTDILFTHGMPEGILDEAGWDNEGNDLHVGCRDLRDRIWEVQPKVYAGGHLHAMGGKTKVEYGTLFINAAICDDKYIPNRMPILVDYNTDTKEARVVDYV